MSVVINANTNVSRPHHSRNVIILRTRSGENAASSCLFISVLLKGRTDGNANKAKVDEVVDRTADDVLHDENRQLDPVSNIANQEVERDMEAYN